MCKGMIGGLVALLVCAVPAFSATIDIGTHELLENTPGQPIQISVIPGNPPELIAGMNLRAQVADGGPQLPPPLTGSIDGPKFELFSPTTTPADLETGTIWTISPLLTNPVVADGRQVVVAGVMLGGADGTTVPADGLLMTLFVDTTGFFHGDSREPWDLLLEGTVGDDTELLASDGTPIGVTILRGAITLVPEPSTIGMLLAVLAGGSLLVVLGKRNRST